MSPNWNRNSNWGFPCFKERKFWRVSEQLEKGVQKTWTTTIDMLWILEAIFCFLLLSDILALILQIVIKIWECHFGSCLGKKSKKTTNPTFLVFIEKEKREIHSLSFNHTQLSIVWLLNKFSWRSFLEKNKSLRCVVLKNFWLSNIIVNTLYLL